LIPQLFIALTAAWSTSPSKIPLPCTQAYSVPDRSTPRRITAWPALLSSLFPDTCSCGAGPGFPVPADVSVAVTVTAGYPVALAVKVALPVLAASAVMVTFCGVA
jgi:hypothetical protein